MIFHSYVCLPEGKISREIPKKGLARSYNEAFEWYQSNRPITCCEGNTPKYGTLESFRSGCRLVRLSRLRRCQGLIFHSSFIGRAQSKNKGRISRWSWSGWFPTHQLHRVMFSWRLGRFTIGFAMFCYHVLLPSHVRDTLMSGWCSLAMLSHLGDSLPSHSCHSCIATSVAPLRSDTWPTNVPWPPGSIASPTKRPRSLGKSWRIRCPKNVPKSVWKMGDAPQLWQLLQAWWAYMTVYIYIYII